MTKLTKAQRARLDKLATYLEWLPKRYRHFDMSVFFSGNQKDEAKYARENGGVGACGTVACAVGHGPAAGILFPRRYFVQGYADWDRYVKLFTSRFGPDFAWCFSGSWHGIDNQPQGAAARIRYMLDRGVPESFNDAQRKYRKLYAPYRIDAKVSA